MIHIHPKFEKKLKVKYQVEYTNEPEVSKDFENIVKKDCKDLDEAFYFIFEFRKRNKYNISLYYLIEDENNWFIEDAITCIEDFTDSKLSDELYQEIYKQNNIISDLSKELDLYYKFLEKYKANDQFKKFKEEIYNN